MQRTIEKSKKEVKSKGNPDGAPRYKPGEHPVYHSAYEQAKNSSPIFNEKVRSNSLEHAGILHNLGATLYELVGEQSGDNVGYFQGKFGKWQLGYIPLARQELEELHQRFKDWSLQQVREGKAREPAKEWPSQLLELRLKKEALLDVRMAEAQHVKNLIEQRKDKQEKKHIEKVLPHGTLGKIESDKDGNLTLADGQRISYTPEGLPYIDESTSPYNKMAIVDYRVMCEKWVHDMGITLDQLRERRKQIFEERKKQAIKNGEMPPEKIGKDLVVTASKLPQWMERLGITKEQWPSWPESVKAVEFKIFTHTSARPPVVLRLFCGRGFFLTFKILNYENKKQNLGTCLHLRICDHLHNHLHHIGF